MSQIPDKATRERMQKLMDRAHDDRGTDENSAAIAMTLLQAMLAKYTMEMSQVSEDDAEVGESGREKVGLVLDADCEWQSELLREIVHNNFCIGSRDYRRKRIYHLCGRSVNIRATVQMYGYLVATINRLCPITDGRRLKAMNSFKQGCSDRLRYRLRDQRNASEKASDVARGSGTDLVLADVYSSEEDLNNDLWHGYPVGTTARNKAETEARWAAGAAEREARYAAEQARRTNMTPAEIKQREAEYRASEKAYARARKQAESKIDHAAYALGQSVGASISLDRQIENTKTQRIA